MSKHTPGPWYFDKPDCCVGPIADKTIGVAAIMRADGDSAKYLFGETSNANANLIAAAPDLLASLEHLMAVIAPQGDERYLTISLTPEYFEHARAAIAKAKGQSK